MIGCSLQARWGHGELLFPVYGSKSRILAAAATVVDRFGYDLSTRLRAGVRSR